MRSFINPFEIKGQWYKGNFHTHTRTSDGALWAEEVVRQYRRHGYSVLALTDHANTNDIRGLSDHKILVINGSELHPPLPRLKSEFHLVGLNLPHGFPLSQRSQQDAQACLNQVVSVGGINILAHPREMSMNYTDLVHLKHLDAIEVWTTLSEMDGELGSSEREWAEAMDHGLFLSATGSDDVHWAPRHGWREAFGGWTMLKMKSLTTKNVLRAIRTGACYASAGPKIHDFRVARGQVSLRCSPVIKIVLKGPGVELMRRHARAGRTLRNFTIDIPDWPFVRAVVTDDRGKQAWTNPIQLRGRRKRRS